MDIPTTDHNEPLAGDDLTTVRFNYQWRKIILDAIDREMSSISATITDESERETFDIRVSNMIEDFYTVEELPAPYQLNTERDTSTQSLLAASSPSAIIWNQGHYVIANPTRILCPENGIYLINCNFRATCASAINWRITLRKNGSQELTRELLFNTTSIEYVLSWQFSALEDDYIEVLITNSVNATLQVTSPPATSVLLVIPAS